MSEDVSKEFKKALFASGLPLEYSAEAVLRRRQFRTVSGDFGFLRAGAHGEMSIDLAAEKLLFIESLERQINDRLESVRVSAQIGEPSLNAHSELGRSRTS